MGFNTSPNSLTWCDGEWGAVNRPLVSAASNALWLASTVFDGARVFQGCAPDLDLHCRRLNRSAAVMGLKILKSAEEIEALCREGIRRFPKGTELYIKPLYWAEDGFIASDPETTRLAINIIEAPLPPRSGISACLSSRRRPGPEAAPTMAKAACLYPNAALALFEARRRGFNNALLLDPLGYVAEFTSSNIFMAKDGVVVTPAPNGCFLNGITRQRVIELLRADGVDVVERSILPAELLEADEIFSTGNYAKITPVVRYEDRKPGAGPFAARAWELYTRFAAGYPV